MNVMQTNFKIKTNWLLALIFMGGGLFLTSCEKEDNTPEDQEVSIEDAADALMGALSNSSEGLAAEMEAAAKVADEATQKNLTVLECGETRDSTTTYSLNNSYITANYSTTWSWGLVCNAQSIPTAVTLGRATQGTYETARMSSDDSAESDWTVTQLLTGPNFVINGSYERDGSQASKVRDMRSFTSDILFTLDDLNIDKGTRRITSGIASFSISGASSTGNSFSFEGDIVFNGDGSATFIINGEQYTIDLY